MLEAFAWAIVPYVVNTFPSFTSRFLIIWRTTFSLSCEDIPLAAVASVFVANMTHIVFCSPARLAVFSPDAIRLFLPDYQA